VLGSYKEAFGRIVDQPSLLAPFVVPTLLVAFLRLAVFSGVDPNAQGRQVDLAVYGLVVLFLGVTWYFVAVGSIVPRSNRSVPRMPGGSVYLASTQAALIVIAPLAAFVGLMTLQPPEQLGGLGLLAAVTLLLAALVVSGRAIGIPVEAAVRGSSGFEAVSRGNARGRERGGLGLTFLALLMLVAVSVAAQLAGTVFAPPVLGAVQVALALVGVTVVGAWVGVAAAIALAGGEHAIADAFECPRCGGTARVEGSTATCECGLEGPYQLGPQG